MQIETLPSRAAGLARLRAFLPQAGRDYARRRNFVLSPGRHGNVSGLSPYIRHRLITEEEVIAATLDRHSAQAAEKFIQEVFWRSYWKGWLEQRPSIWSDYLRDLDAALEDVADRREPGQGYRDAVAGRTGIECFDAWSAELRESGYLHNHARMWFGSIWIFTLGLRWELGADLFMRQLLDGDAASNTLSWRWVAGLQTRGKHYLARAENIRCYTSERYFPRGQLNETAEAPESPPHPSPRELPDLPAVSPSGRAALLLTEDDLHAESLGLAGAAITGVAGLVCTDQRSPQAVSATVSDFVTAAMNDALDRASGYFNVDAGPVVAAEEAGKLITWLKLCGMNRLLYGYAPVGPVQDTLAALSAQLQPHGISLTPVLRDWDRRCWPHARRGFFAFRKRIPELLPADSGARA